MVQSPSSPQSSQNVAVVIEINAGSFVEGFSLLLLILEDGHIIQEHKNLPDIPAAPQMPQLYKDWQKISVDNSRVLQAVDGQATNVSDWRQRTTELRNYCREWFQHNAFGSLRDRIRANARVRRDQSVPIIIRCSRAFDTENDILRRLPWHLWDLFSHSQLPNAEFALFTQYHRPVARLEAPIRVLAIFGSRDGGLQLQEDEAALQILEQRGARIKRISEPSPEILSGLLFDENWDILFFAGHSSSQGNSSTIQISQGNNLPLDALRRSLTTAVTRGLKLAIFNSCDGLGIADFLIELNLPVVIVMREPVPDRVASQFLLNLLNEFSKGTPLCLAVRKARERLEGIEFNYFPAASWLPVICVNPNQPELVWPAPTAPPPPPPLWRRLLSNLRQFITRFLVSPAFSLLSRLRSYFGRYYLIVLGFAAFTLVVIIAVAGSITSYHCQIFPSICIENFISYGEKPIANSKVKLRGKYLKEKQKSIEQFRQGKYEEAWKTFDKLHPRPDNPLPLTDNSPEALAALQDPEILIYRNNAVVRNWHKKNPNEPIYTIAVAAPLNIEAGMGIFLGVAQAQDAAVNNRTIYNKPINLQVVIANDNNNPEQARRIADRLYRNNEILAVVGHYTSANTCEALNVYSQKSQDSNPLVVISPTSSRFELPSKPECGGDRYKVFFRTVSTTKTEAESLVEYLTNPLTLNKSEPKVVIFYKKGEQFSEDLKTQFVHLLTAKKGSVIGEAIDLSQPNFDANQLPPGAENADALVVLPDGGTKDDTALKNAVKVILNSNNEKKPVLGANSLYLQKVIDDAKNTDAKDTIVNRLFLAVDWHPAQCGAEKFAEEINKYWGGDLNRRTALTDDAVQALLKAIELSKPSISGVNRNSIRQQLFDARNHPNFAAGSNTIKGSSIRFRSSGDRIENTTRTIVTVNEQLKFDLPKKVTCPKQQENYL